MKPLESPHKRGVQCNTPQKLKKMKPLENSSKHGVLHFNMKCNMPLSIKLEPAKPKFVTQHSKSYHILWTNFTNSPTTQPTTQIFGETRPYMPEEMLRQLSKLEPVPEKPEIYGMRIPNPWILSTDKAPKPQ
ncbi:hypothetical protein PIB30_090207 [Stylosanthes scabra]|uniref:Uncharacterized protein n=1 Tax=Stylosanthes scabra TaxID=79078 RepID=A0ABU6SV24_9FABA|nr:hypothetical protein [Stylosanthes scabra]